MRHFAIVGSGPAGFYTAEALDNADGDRAELTSWTATPSRTG